MIPFLSIDTAPEMRVWTLLIKFSFLLPGGMNTQIKIKFGYLKNKLISLCRQVCGPSVIPAKLMIHIFFALPCVSHCTVWEGPGNKICKAPGLQELSG